MYLKPWLAGALVCSALFSGATILNAADRTDPQVRIVEEIVAKVNGKIITRGELEKQHERIQAELEKQGLTGAALKDATDKAASDALREQIDQLLLVQKASELNINVDSDVNKQIAKIQRESGIADPEKFHDWVRQNAGESFEDLKDTFKNNLLTQRVIGEEVYRTVVIPKSEQQKYYEQHKADFVRQESVALSEIQVLPADDTPAKVAAAEKKAKDIVDRLRKGEKFVDLAHQYSDNPDTAKADGFLCNCKRGELAKPIEDAVFTQSKGYITDPIHVGKAFEILRVEEHINSGQASFDEVQNQINNILAEPQVQPKLRAYLTTLRQNAFLQIKDGYVDSGAAPGKDTSWKDPATLKPQTTTKEAVANQRHTKKFMKVIPYGRTGVKDAQAAPPPQTAPIPATPVKNADGSTPQ
jgi:peptidyl-prolyl cis-trans isomerase SurA